MKKRFYFTNNIGGRKFSGFAVQKNGKTKVVRRYY